jgi:hypothetical protein
MPENHRQVGCATPGRPPLLVVGSERQSTSAPSIPSKLRPKKRPLLLVQGPRIAQDAAFGARQGRFESEKFNHLIDGGEVPGPGQYSIPSMRDSVSHNVKGGGELHSKSRRFSAPASRIPGPGTYNGVLVKGREPPACRAAFSGPLRRSFFEDCRSKLDTSGPGPGSYSEPLLHGPISQQRPRLSSRFSSSSLQRDLYRVADTPSPGHYEPALPSRNACLGASALRSSTARCIEFAKTDVPGVGEYETAVLPGKGSITGSATFQKSDTRRLGMASNRDRTPGPGEYAIDHRGASSAPYQGTSTFLSTSQRSINLAQGVPGPAFYHPHLACFNPKSFMLNATKKWV